jgi:predicted acetyltransferase
MAIQLRWVGENDLDRVAETRLRCYAKSQTDFESFKLRVRSDPRTTHEDYLLAEIDGAAVGTATHISFNMWCRAGCVPCQGVAWVGAIKTMRRRGTAGTPGVASSVMREMLRHARERGDAVSALMPFRASYYEHFGYGIVERRHDWTVPIAALPAGPFETIRYFEPGDFDARADCLRRINRGGQCEIERSAEQWKSMAVGFEGFELVDRDDDGSVRGAMAFQHHHIDGKDIIKVVDCIYEDAAALRRQLHFLSSMKDQFATAQLTLPADVPLNRMISESQIPHRPVNHPVSRCHPFTRMQVRVLDHAKFLQSLRVPAGVKGRAVVGVHECEGGMSRFAVEVEGGRISCEPIGGSVEFECTDRTWAGIACGDLKASDAIRFGLASGVGAAVLDVLAMGPAPFTHEGF